MKLAKLLSVGLVLMFAAKAASFEGLNYQHFAHMPLVTQASVSPDGKYVTAILNSKDGPSVVLSEFGSPDLKTLAILKEGRDRVDGITWIGSKRLLIAASYAMEYSKKRWRQTRYFAVNIDGSNLLEIAAPEYRQAASWERQRAKNIRLVDTMPEDNDHILVQVYDYKDKAEAVFKVNIHSNEFSKVFINKYNVHTWVVDNKGEVRFGFATKENYPDVLQQWIKDPKTNDWKLLKEYKNMTGDTFSPAGFQDGKLLVISDRETNRESLWEFDISTGEFGKMIYSHPEYDITGVVENSDETKIIGVRYMEHFNRIHYFDTTDQDLNKLVANSFPGYETVIASGDLDRKKLLVLAYKNDSPAKYFWLDLNKKAGGFWYSQYPYLEGQTLGKTEHIVYEARDGLEINAYLTMPPSVKGNKKPPLVILPHGGPFGVRDNQSFDYMVQFLANLGYAVIQPNYRGSGGYGSVFQAIGYKEWGAKMQEDLYDAVSWVKKNKVADTKNACFVGWSYGGYAALTAAYQKPGDYKCIVSIAGLSDIALHADEHSRRTSALTDFTREAIGDVSIEEDLAQLKKASAINYLQRIEAPVLLIHGKNDTQVHYGQSEMFYEAGKKAGLDIDYIEYETGTHYLDEYNNRLDAFMHIEKFLKKHLKAK
ncbi:alpha/beta hydrolase family protein [Psychrosphaera haliotis]|uniref:Alpha/beta fold hydrolase n=1 Tax=Psychrosphaera haliotis TaxID=555083 RepID=A0A6N8FGQ7_9GAMM|nr:alpha/beta fold hydrolase [Psychrosphaera haliotis]MUH73441.1 alpha/beta fold hydrolase [Psychrosphaera haliotis]